MDKTIRKLRFKLQHKQTEKIAWKVIREYFMYWHLEDFEEEIDDILLGALTSNEIEKSKGRDRFNMILFCEYTKLLIQAIELLHKKNQAKTTTA